MKVFLLPLLTLFSIHLSAQQIQVQYYTPAAVPGAAPTRYTLHADAAHSLFISHAIGLDDRSDVDAQVFSLSLGLKEDNWLYTENASKRILYQLPLITQEVILVEDEVQTIQWTLHPEQKTIETFTCMKATGHFRGRDYIAWWTPSVPIAAGPWKIRGLPGLILELSDAEEKVKLLFESLRPSDFPIEEPTIKEKVYPFEEAHSLQKKAAEKHFRFMEARLKKNGTNIKVNISSADPWERSNN